MKNNILKIVLALFVTVTYTSCEEDLVVFDAQNGQSAYSFGTQSYNVSVPPEDLTITVPVEVTTVSSQARMVPVVIDAEATTGVASEYTIGAVSIPAGSHMGSLDISLNFAGITGEDGDTKDLVINLDAPAGSASYFDTVSITYFREIICNDLELEVISDIFGTETSYDIKDANGNVVAGAEGVALFGGNFCAQGTYTESINLPDGDYVFTVYDSFGDGQAAQNDGCGPDTIFGSYKLSCSIIIHAQGSQTGSSDVINFSVNP